MHSATAWVPEESRPSPEGKRVIVDFRGCSRLGFRDVLLGVPTRHASLTFFYAAQPP